MSNFSLRSSYEDVSHQLFPLAPVFKTDLKSAPLCWHQSASSWPFRINQPPPSPNILLAVFLPLLTAEARFSGLVFRHCSSLCLFLSRSLFPFAELAGFLQKKEKKNPPTARSLPVGPRSSKPPRKCCLWERKMCFPVFFLWACFTKTTGKMCTKTVRYDTSVWSRRAQGL